MSTPNTPHQTPSFFPMLKEGAFLSARIFGVLLASVNPAVISYPILLEILSSIDGIKTNDNNNQLSQQQEAFRQSMLHLMQKTADRDHQIAEIMKLNGFLLPEMVKNDELKKLLSKPGNYAAKKLVDGESVNPGFVKIITDAGVFEMPPGVAAMLCEKESPPELNTSLNNGNLLVFPEEQKLILPDNNKLLSLQTKKTGFWGVISSVSSVFFPSLEQKLINYINSQEQQDNDLFFLPDVRHRSVPELKGNDFITLSKIEELQRFKRFFITSHTIPHAGLRVLLHSSNLKNISSLYLTDCHLDDTSLEIISLAPIVKNLTEIDLSKNKFSPLGLKTLLNSRKQKPFYSFKCNWNNIQDKGLEYIITAKILQEVEELEIDHNNISEQGLISLANAPLLKTIKALDISNNLFTKASLKAVLNSEYINNLKILKLGKFLSDLNMSKREREAFNIVDLVINSNLPSDLEELDLTGWKLEKKDAKLLRERFNNIQSSYFFS